MTKNELNEQLKAIEQDYETIATKSREIKNSLINKFDAILARFLPSNMVVRDSDMDPDYVATTDTWSWKYGCRVIRSDFDKHSDFDFAWDTVNGLQINNYCIGTYDKHETGYIDALRTMVQIWEHADEIGEEFAKIDLSELSKLREERYKILAQRRQVEKGIEKIDLEEFEKKMFTVGTQIQLQKDNRDNLFNTRIFSSKYNDNYLNAVVTKITPKKVYFTIVYKRGDYSYKDTEVSVKKENLTNIVFYQGGWDVISNN